MKAVQINNYGHSDTIRINEVEKPHPSAGQVLIEVHASSINPVDIAIREGYMSKWVPLQFPITLGYDVAGIVSETGSGVKNFKPGDRIYGQAGAMFGASGGFAEYAITMASAIAKMPKNISFPEAASIALTGVSAVEALYNYIGLKKKQKILIHGGAGGIGSIAIQLAKHIGAFVASTAGGNDIEFIRRLGADEPIDYRTQEFDRMLSGYDAVFDTVGGDTYTRSFGVLKKGGIIVSMKMQPDENLMKQYGVKALYEGTKVITKHLEMLSRLIEKKALKIYIEKTFPLDKITDAFVIKEKGGVKGKIAISIRD